MSITVCATCNHLEEHHDAGECWAEVDGQKQCRCSWYEPGAKIMTADEVAERRANDPAFDAWIREGATLAAKAIKRDGRNP